MDVTADWYWEGNVVEAIACSLVANGWTIISKSNTHTKEPGIDIHATKNGGALLVEVKGFPSKFYRDPRRAGKHKPTSPTNQAQHWYSHALLKAMRLKGKYPDAIVALGFPDFQRYRDLFAETRSGLERLGFAVLTISENGEMEAWGL